MAVAAWLVWRRGGFGAQRKPLVLFVAQLAFNGLWGWLFFAWQRGGWELLDIALLWLLYRRDHRGLLANQSAGRVAARALYRVGQLRRDAQSHALATQPPHSGRLTRRFETFS